MAGEHRPDCQVSVVIPAYRVTPYIAETLDSVLTQTFRGFEIIVVNDACPDTAALEQVLEPYRSKIVYLKQPVNAGPSAARNRGIHAARGEFVAFLDGDDLYEPQYLEVQLRHFREHPEADMIYGSALIFGDDPCVGMPIEAFCPSDVPISTVSLLKGEVTVFLLSVIRREMLFRAGLFDEDIRKCEDFDLWLRVTKLGGRILHHSEPIAHYRKRGDSASADATEMRQYLGRVAAKFEREFELTAEESQALVEARRKWTAEDELARGKELLGQRKFGEAAVQFRNASRYFKRKKLSAMAALLTWAPGLVQLAMWCRDLFSHARPVAQSTR